MISKTDIQRYLKEANDLERKMAKFYRFLADTLENPYYKERFRRLSEQEGGHVRLLEEIKALFEDT
ncbi:MAG: ferritin family protein [Thermodesulfobacteriota bacterium]|nr:ferritin family protein [Thermodesulfobacteriota bacterium]